MTTAAELKAAHLEQIKTFLKEYVSTGKEVCFKEPCKDGFSSYVLTDGGLYTGGYARFKGLEGVHLTPLLINSNYKGIGFLNSYENLYSNDDFYKNLQYGLAVRLLSSVDA
jgi:hypothetical protein